MRSKLVGGILLIIGTSIGAGMLALPTSTAAGGFYHGFIAMTLAWLLMTIGSLFIFEVTLWLPENSNFITMARKTLGKGVATFTWFAYLILLYTLISAYIAGGTDLLNYLLDSIGINNPDWLATLLFVLLLGSIVFHGVKLVDWSNRGLMLIKLAAFFLLVFLVLPRVNLLNLEGGHWRKLAGASMLLFTAFGYATVIPTLRSYFGSNVKKLRFCVWVGSFISLVCYLAWNFVVQGSIASQGTHGLVAIAESGRAASQLTDALSTRLHSSLISYFAHLFSSICVLTSFLGVSLCLTDFLADGFGIEKQGHHRWLVVVAALLPPMLIVMFEPGLFILGLSYAGILCILLLMGLPALMAWRGRYHLKLQGKFTVFGGRPLILLILLVSVVLIVQGVIALF